VQEKKKWQREEEKRKPTPPLNVAKG